MSESGKSELHKLVAKQLAKATGSSGELDIALLGRLMSTAYEEMEHDRRRVDRANKLMAEELNELTGNLERAAEDLRVQNERFEAALDNMSQGLCLLDSEGRIIVCNRRFLRIYGLPPDTTVADRPIAEILAASAILERPESYLELIPARNGATLHQELNDGRIILVAHEPLAGGGSVDTFEDVTERHRAEVRIAHMARHDPLTDLPNRVLLRERLERALLRAARGGQCAILCLDLDRFKTVNDTLGHPAGDALLQGVAGRLRECLRNTDTIARLGGDEFALVVEMPPSHDHLRELAARLVEQIARPYDIHGHKVIIGVTIGIAVSPQDGLDAAQLTKSADIALYCAKTKGRGCFRFYEPQMGELTRERYSLEQDLRKALLAGELALFYQPLINLRPRRINGFEALLRWNSPERGLVMPGAFVPLAEETGLIAPIGEWLIRQACRDAAAWPEPLKLAVNLSAGQLKSHALIPCVQAALDSSGLAPARLEIEITESALIADTEATLLTLRRLKDLGVSVSMDDFGTGYSSLSYLRRFPFDKIKIDRSFVKDLGQRPDAIAIVRAVTGLCSGLGMQATAEGVESEEQLAVLAGERCTEVQGYLFSEARPAEAVAEIVANFGFAAAEEQTFEPRGNEASGRSARARLS
jgi:diguanylate cyclase (GGDEF)-like protein/PAS domain S-box-containing protein